MLLIPLPALLLAINTAREQGISTSLTAQREALFLAQLAASNQEQLIEGARQLLVSVSQLPEVRSGDTKACNAIFRDLRQQFSNYTNLFVIDAEGNSICTGLASSSASREARQAWFKQTAQANGFSVGDYSVGPASRQPVVSFSYPIYDENKNVKFMVGTALSLGWMEYFLRNTDLPPQTAITTIDRNGMILYHYPGPEDWIGKPHPNAELVRTVLSQGTGTIEARGLVGPDRLFGFAPLNKENPGAYVLVGMSGDLAYANTNRVLLQQLLGLGMTALITLAAGWYGANRFVVRPVHALVDTTTRLAEGDLSVRVDPLEVIDTAELAKLSHAFNNMAAALEERQQALTHTNAALSAEVEERKRIAEALRESHEQLERRVAERTAELAAANRALQVEMDERKLVEKTVRDQREWFRITLASIGDAVIVTDVAGDITFINPVAETLTGWSQNEALGKPITEIFPIFNEETRKAVENPLRRVLEEGVIVGLANHTILVARDGTEHPIDDSGAPIRDDSGNMIGAVLVFRDITARRRSEQIQEFLSNSSVILAGSLDYQTTLTSVAQLAVPTIADWCSVHVKEGDGSIQQLAVAHVDPEKVKWAYELQRRFPPNPDAPTGLYQVIRSGQPEFYPNITDEMLTAAVKNEEQLQIAREIGFTSAMVVPLTAHGHTLGAIQFVSTDSKYHYGPVDFQMAEELARRAALAIDNAHLYRRTRQAQEAAERAVERMTRLQEITAALSESLTPQQVADVCLTKGLAALNAITGMIALLTEDGTTLEIIHTAGFPPEAVASRRRYPIDYPVPTAEATRTGQPIWLSSYAEREQQFPNVPTIDSARGARAAIPLSVKGRVIGSMGIGFAESREFGAEDRVLMLALGQQCAQALDRAQLYAAVESNTEVLREKVAERTRELEEAMLQAQSADRAKSALLSTVSHEMRTPLSSIIGFSNLILSRKPPPDKLAQYAHTINAEAKRLANLINDFLDLQRIESGREVFRFAEVDLAILLQDAVASQNPGENSPHTIRLDIEPVPKVYIDADRIRQVALNLLSNAFKYSSGGEISVALRREDNQVLVAIRDLGIGIQPEELDRLFERFYRGNDAERLRIRGTGLGLALCREIIQAHGGRIWAESEGQDRGSTFLFTIPIPGLKAQKPPETTPELAVQPSVDKLIVVIEDDRNFLNYLTERLGPEGYSVRVVAFEDATPDYLAQLNPRLILLDILKGEKQLGWTLLVTLKQHPLTRRIPVVVCSFLHKPDLARQLGASAFINKPVDESFLLKELARLMGVSPRKALIVDDSEAARLLLYDTLIGAGYQAETVDDGRAAIERLKHSWPDLIILDLLMPDIDGFGVLHWIRDEQRNWQVPIIAFTATDLNDKQQEFLKKYASAVAIKSNTSPQQLLDLISNVLAPQH